MYSIVEYQAAHQFHRDDEWLRRQLNYIWDHFFPDVPRVNQVDIEFAKRWKTRLGLIRLSEDDRETYIGINRLLKQTQVPYAVCMITIAHEIVHYANGFGSPLPRAYSHPHSGNVVARELVRRGMRRELDIHDEWIEYQWQSFYKAQRMREAAAAARSDTRQLTAV